MRKRALRKDTLRELRSSVVRFLSILTMTALGVFVFTGLKVTGPRMRHTANDYAVRQNMYDVEVSSVAGLDRADVDIARRLSLPHILEEGYDTDLEIDGVGVYIRLRSLGETISVPDVVEGRLPQSPGEVALEKAPATESIAVGDTISFLRESKKLKIDDGDDLKRYAFRVVGKVISADSLAQGTKGMDIAASRPIDTIGFILRADFAKTTPDVVRIRLTDAPNNRPKSAAYRDAVTQAKDELIAAYRPRVATKFAQMQEKLKDAIQDGRKRVAEARQKLEDGKRALDDGRKKLQDARKTLDARRKEADRKAEEGRAEIEDGRVRIREARAKIDDAETELLRKEALLSEGEHEYATAAETLGKNKAALDGAKAELDGKRQQLADGRKAAESAMDEVNRALEALKASAGDPEVAGKAAALEAQKATLSAELAKIEAGEQELATAAAALERRSAEWASGKEALERQRATLDESKAAIRSGKAELEEQRAELKRRALALEEQAVRAEKQITEGRKTLEDAEEKWQASSKTLSEEEADFQAKERDARRKIEDGESAIREAHDLLERLRRPKYDVTTRLGEPAMQMLMQSGDKLDLVSGIFPVFFYFIAVLVSMTTMTRMVEERRTQIGTYKALGYGKWDIAKKYIFYGLSASLIGGAIGAFCGSVFLPQVIYHGYAASFVVKTLEGISDPMTNIAAIALAVALNVGAIYSVLRRNLRENSAQLLRPKSPGAVKTLWIERITPLWRRLGFLTKVTARNVFRYKKRMFMTIFGIAGCTGLLFLGFGLRESIGGLKKLQFHDVMRYDLMVLCDAKSGEAPSVPKALSGGEIGAIEAAYYEQMLSLNPVGPDRSVTLIVPEHPDRFSDVFLLRKRRAFGRDVLLDAGAGVIDTKLARYAGKDGTLKLMDDNLEVHTLRYRQTADIYHGFYAFLSPEGYADAFGKRFVPNAFFVKLKDGADIASMKAELIDDPGVLTVVDNAQFLKLIDDWMHSVRIIVYVIILCSGMLAFVVLYNLTNINISERMRELCTIKVLGFRPVELAQYIYRETYLLALMGILLGYGFGWFLLLMIVEVLPPEHVMLNTMLTFRPYVYSALISLAFTLVVRLIVARRMRTISMIEALKSYD